MMKGQLQSCSYIKRDSKRAQQSNHAVRAAGYVGDTSVLSDNTLSSTNHCLTGKELFCEAPGGPRCIKCTVKNPGAEERYVLAPCSGPHSLSQSNHQRDQSRGSDSTPASPTETPLYSALAAGRPCRPCLRSNNGTDQKRR